MTRIVPAAAFLALALAAAGCTVNPATGEQSFTAFMSEGDEIRIGRETHPKLLEEFGGAYDDPEIARYVASIGGFLASTSERPNLPFTFTVVDSPMVNAFALPGGYVYVTRGLLALAGNEAELAGVLAHEIGHVTARHAAQRYSQAVLAQIGLAGLGLATGSGALADIAGAGAAIYLQGYSRDQEFEADTLGVRYLSRATYDTGAMSGFLEKLLASSRFDAELAGRPGAADAYDILSTHPRTLDRVERAVLAAGAAPVADPLVARDVYLDKIDGMLFGDDPEEGFVRGRRFLHPGLRFAFEVPPGFRLHNSAKRVVARGPEDAAIVFDAAPEPSRARMVDYLVYDWGRDAALDEVAALDIDGLEAATGRTRVQTDRGPLDLRLVAIRFDADTIFRFIFATPPALTERLSLDLRRTTYSFRRLSAAEASSLRPQRLRVVTARSGDTVADLAQRLPFDDYREERFRVLNGLGPADRLVPGQRVKIVVE
ncbi:MAG TPA: M48 family metalloprotease [Dongiaceae bacterium]|nr:M48 family metalloprotease [Dongiaceae bacterium]